MQDRINKAISGLNDAIGEKPVQKEDKADDQFKKLQQPGEGETPEDQKFLYWEPENMSEKWRSTAQNSFELIVVSCVAGSALVFSSIVAVGFFCVSLIMLRSQSMKLHRRIFWGFIAIGLKSFLLLSVVIWKIRKAKTMITQTTEISVFKYEITFYESLGFDLNYIKEELIGTSTPTDGKYVYSCNMVMSFMFEIFLTCLIMGSLIYLFNMKQRITFLTNTQTI